MINIRELDKKIALLEGKKKQTSMGNVREVRKLVLSELAKYPDDDVLKTLRKYK